MTIRYIRYSPHSDYDKYGELGERREEDNIPRRINLFSPSGAYLWLIPTTASAVETYWLSEQPAFDDAMHAIRQRWIDNIPRLLALENTDPDLSFDLLHKYLGNLRREFPYLGPKIDEQLDIPF